MDECANDDASKSELASYVAATPGCSFYDSLLSRLEHHPAFVCEHVLLFLSCDMPTVHTRLLPEKSDLKMHNVLNLVATKQTRSLDDDASFRHHH